MAKLVLLKEDGSTRDLVLDKERLTLGRRADNDVCLPDPAVSGEHAQVVTLLSDSFLEDLGSTNGTLVNGEPVQKHFLRDGDVIDLGRQRLLYFVDERAQPTPAAREEARRRARTDSGAFDTDTPSQPTQWTAPRAEPGSPHLVAAVAPEARPSATALGAPPPVAWSPAVAGQPAASPVALASVAGVAGPSLASGARAASAHVDDEPPCLTVLTGPSAGRTLALVKEVTSVGRAGLQVALVRRTPDGYVVTAGEGSDPPRLNGERIDAGGALLVPGDVLEVAGARIEFSAPPDLPT